MKKNFNILLFNLFISLSLKTSPCYKNYFEENINLKAHLIKVINDRVYDTIIRFKYVIDKDNEQLYKWKTKFDLFKQYIACQTYRKLIHANYRFFRWLQITVKRLKDLKCQILKESEYINNDQAILELPDNINWLNNQLDLLEYNNCIFINNFNELIQCIKISEILFRESQVLLDQLVNDIENFNETILDELDKLQVECCCSF